jgi:bacterioferritin (cytochrome b1)
MSDDDPMDLPAVHAGLSRALTLQYRSAVEYAVVAGSLTGLPWQALSPQLWSFGQAELDDLRRLVEKLVALGGTPPSTPESFEAELDAERALGQLLDHECEAVAALADVIPATGQEPRSEALEHRLEHLIMRKQEQVDTLRRILDRPED